jgi:hypothetical protein
MSAGASALDDLFQSDNASFPSAVDPATSAKAAAALQKHLKEQKAAEAEAKKQSTAAAKAAKAMPKAVAAPTPAQARRTSDVKLHKIRMYFANAGTAKKLSIKEPKVYPKTDEEVDELLRAIEADLASQGGIESASLAFINIVSGFETLTQSFNPLNLELSGPAVSLTQATIANKGKWEDIVTEFAIANAEWFMVGPTKRLAFTVVQIVMAVNQANKIAAASAAAAPASAKLKDESMNL